MNRFRHAARHLRGPATARHHRRRGVAHDPPRASLLRIALLLATASPFRIMRALPCRGPSVRRPCSALAASASPQFEAGDEVLVADDDGATHVVGVIERKRGGWYTVSLQDSTTSVKRRGSQLQRKSGSSTDSRPSASGEYAGDSVTDDDGEAPPAPPADVLDLDSILKYGRHKSENHGQRLNLTTGNNQTVSSDVIDQIASCHSQYDKWVVFSDLHVMPSTLPVCLEVLDFVHAAALDREAGILFLGDFWHHRGFVRVDCLNAVLDAMSRWTVPCVMMPGNHDQVDWRGAEHALTPLGNAYRIRPGKGGEVVDNVGTKPLKQCAGPLVISQPTKFMNALFVPHIRDKSLMRSILSSKEARSSSALFVHADVKGASMNDLIKSQHGINASEFPADKHVYSGHFHKPHVVTAGGKKSSKCISIRYVGSPYQTSFSEAGQSKSLLLLDSLQGWKCVEEVPIDVGPRYHRVSSLRRFLDPDTSVEYRRGDRVAVAVCRTELEEMRTLAANNTDANEPKKAAFDVRLEELRAAGVAVEVRDGQPEDGEGPTGAGRTPTKDEDRVELEELSPAATLAAYLESEVQNGELGEATAKMLLENGKELLREVNEGSAGGANGRSKCAPGRTAVSELEIESVSVVGFGSFRREAVYPLRDRGVVLLRGTNEDLGSDSNGVGKSTLAMASLWALAGSVDPRPAQDGKVSDVVNDSSRVAEVALRGSINGRPFHIRRSKGTRSSSLTFELDGSDLTRQSSKDTQTLIDEHLGVESQMLRRTVFHGQHAIGGLLESSDAKLKEELSHLVSLEIWQQSASLARAKQREKTRRVAELEGMLSLRGEDRARAEAKSRAAMETMERRKMALENEWHVLLQQEQLSPSNQSIADIEREMNLVQTQIDECETDIKGMEEGLTEVAESRSEEMNALRSELNEIVAIEEDSRVDLQACQRRHDVSVLELESAERQLNHLRSEWDATTSSFPSPQTCRTCGQPIVSSSARKHVVESIEKRLDAAVSLVDKSKEAILVAEQARTEATAVTRAHGLKVETCMTLLREKEGMLSLETDGLRRKIMEYRSVQSTLSSEFASLARKSKEIAESNIVKSRLEASANRSKEAFHASVSAYEDCCSDLAIIEAQIDDLEKEKEAMTSSASVLAALADKVGPKGVQAFVLRNIVQALQYCSSKYLDELSEGSLQLRMQIGSNDSILKQAAVLDTDGTWRTRPLSSLSGGQWKRCSLAFNLGFVDLASKRGRLRSSLLVLDEPLTHLDSAGRKGVGRLLRRMLSRNDGGIGKAYEGSGGFGLSTILVILQEIAAQEIEECFDQIDEVVKSGGESFVVLDDSQ